MKELVTKLMAFAELAVFTFAGIGSTCYLAYIDKPQFAIANLLITAMATPECKKAFYKLTH